MIKFYCTSCGDCQPVIFCDMTKDDLNDEPWADILCLKCRLVIATITSDKEGKIKMEVTE